MNLKIYKRSTGKLFVDLPYTDTKEIEQYKAIYDSSHYKYVIEGE